MKKELAAAACAAFLAVPGLLASSSNPPDFYPGVQGMASCLSCHDTFGKFGGPGSVELSGLPERYIPEKVYTVKMKVKQSGAKRFGFQLYTVDQNGNQAGQILTDDLKQDVRKAKNVTFLKHSFHGSQAEDQQTWTFRWKAPADPSKKVGVYGEALAGDGHEEVKNDHVYKVEAVVEADASAADSTETIPLSSQPLD